MFSHETYFLTGKVPNEESSEVNRWEGQTEANRLQIHAHNIEKKQKESHWFSFKVNLLQHKQTVTVPVSQLSSLYQKESGTSLFFLPLFYLGTRPTLARRAVEPALQA